MKVNDESYITSIEEQAAFYRKEQKVYEYAKEFWKELVPFGDPMHVYVNDDILPLYCYDEMAEIVAATKRGENYCIAGGMVNYKKTQAVIRIGIDGKDDALTEELKKLIRHEIIHYFLWMINLPHNDNDLMFWCYCYMFDGGAYEKLSAEDKKQYTAFQKVYDKYIRDEKRVMIKSFAILILINTLNETKSLLGVRDLSKIVKDNMEKLHNGDYSCMNEILAKVSMP